MADNTKPQTGVDDALKLRAIYYSAPIPRNARILTVLGAVFDEVHFPRVYLPTYGFDQTELEREIKRIEELKAPSRDREPLLGILKFTKYAKTLEGFCIFGGKYEEIFAGDVSSEMVNSIYTAIHGPHPPGWQPMFFAATTKQIPGSDQHVAFPGDYHYMGEALLESAKTGMPLLSDIPGLPIPGIEASSPKNDAQILSAILAIECVKVALPELPLLRPEDLMEFRDSNESELRAFRRSMLRYSVELNRRISSATAKDIDEITHFFVQTEIVPTLDELKAAMNAPARSWFKRAVDMVRVLPELGAAIFTMDPATAVAKVLTTYAGQLFVEVAAKGDQIEARRRSGLFYLLKLQAFQSDRAL